MKKAASILVCGIFFLVPVSAFAETALTASDFTTGSTPTIAVSDLPAAPVTEPGTRTTAYTEQWSYEGSTLSPVTSTESSTDQVTVGAAGRTFYVSATGSNTAEGSQTKPWAAVAYAVSKLQAGDTLFIHEGNYKVDANFSASGRADAYITIQGLGNVVIDNGSHSIPAFDTQGNDFIRFKNLTVKNSLAAVEISTGSSYVEIDGLKTDGNRFAVRVTGGSNITMRNVYADNSKNAFRASGGSRNLLFEDIQAYNSKDTWDGMNPDYLNGDGFIIEADVSNVTMRRIISANHWDAGFDIKAENVLIENAVAYGNKNNYKTWGTHILIKSSLSHSAKSQPRSDGSTVEGNGITVNGGITRVVNMTFADNEDHDVRIYRDGNLTLENSIAARRTGAGDLYKKDSTALFTEKGTLWFDTRGTKPMGLTLSPTSLYGDPKFVDWVNKNYHLQMGSPAIDSGTTSSLLSVYDLDLNPRTANDQPDLGAYEYGSTAAQPAPAPEPVPMTPTEPAPAEEPVDEPEQTLFTGLQNGDEVGGKIYFGPSAELVPTLARVTYYIDGKKITSTTSKPYRLGGSKGYSLSKLLAGGHTLTAVYQTRSGETGTLDVDFVKI